MRRFGLSRGLAAALVCTLALAPGAVARNRFDTRVLAHVGSPGYPALSLVAPDRTIYVGTFTDAAGSDTGPSKVFAYSASGKLLRTYVIKGQTPGAAHGVQVAAIDKHGVLYLLDQNPSRVLKLNPRTGKQTTYGTFSDVLPCVPATPPADCSDTVIDNPPEPDYAAWGRNGAMYVTDYTQALIWRVPPGGGQAHVWFTDPRLDGTNFGPAGIILMPDRSTLMFDTSAGGATDPPPDSTTGELYKLPIQVNGQPGILTKVWSSGPAEGPDGFALARSGNVYMALVGPMVNQLVVISPTGVELARFPTDKSGNNGSSVPFDEPSSVQFDGRRMIVTNDAFFSGDPSHFVIFDVWAGELGAPVFVPGRKGPGAGGYSLTVTPRTTTVGDERRFRFHAGKNGSPLSGALVTFAGERVRTGRGGNANIVEGFEHAGVRTAKLIVGGHVVAKTSVRIRPESQGE